MAITKTDLVKLAQILAKAENTQDMNDIIAQVKTAQTNMRNIIKSAFTAGDKVKFRNNIGNLEYGFIVKMNPKTVVVKTDIGMWKVSPALLEAAM
jgi:predicted Zn-dependent protease